MTIIIITSLLSFLSVAVVIIIRLQKHNRDLTDENRRLTLENARTSERLNVMAENEARGQEATRDRFAAMAAEALERNAKTLNEQNRMQIAELLAPMKEILTISENHIQMHTVRRAKSERC